MADGTTYTTTYRYDALSRLLSESRTPGDYSESYAYDLVGNRTSREKDGTTVTYTYDDNDKLTDATGGGQSASFGYDSNGNMTSVTGDLLGTWSLTYDDANRPTLITYPGGSDIFLYNASGQRMRANLNGTISRYVYNGERVLEQTDDAGALLTRYATASGSYYGPLLAAESSDGNVRYPTADLIGTSRRLVDASGVATDAYSLDAFGRSMGGWGTTPNPYRYGAAWGYISDAQGSGLLQLGQRYYWPEVGRFLQQDPLGDGANPYVYVANSPLMYADADGQFAIVAVLLIPGVAEGLVAIGLGGGAWLATHGHGPADLVPSIPSSPPVSPGGTVSPTRKWNPGDGYRPPQARPKNQRPKPPGGKGGPKPKKGKCDPDEARKYSNPAPDYAGPEPFNPPPPDQTGWRNLWARFMEMMLRALSSPGGRRF